jgi:zinc protease
MTYRALGNGLRVLLHRDPHAPLVCTTIAYPVGSRNETAGRTGFAHLFEHLMFEGSTNVPRGAFDEYCEGAGGYNNAYTCEDKTCYYSLLPSHQSRLALWLESDRLAGLALTPEALETQRSVVLEEKKQRVENQPYGAFDHLMAELLYPAHPYGHSVLGSTEDLVAASMADVTDFHATHYRPDNAVLVVAGDIDFDETMETVEAYFGDIPRGPRPAPPVPAPSIPDGERRLQYPDIVPLPALFHAYRTPPEPDADFIALDLLSDILGSGEASRLHRSLVYEKHLASSASAYVDGRQGEGMLLLHAMASPGTDPAALEEALDAEIALLLRDGITDEEMERTRNRVETSSYHALQTLSIRADRMAHYALFYDDPDLVHTMLERYRRCSADDILAAARRCVVRERRAALQFVPRDGGAEHAELSHDTTTT